MTPVLIFVAITLSVIVFVVSSIRPPIPDETLALRLAAAFDGTPPELAERGWRTTFRIRGARYVLTTIGPHAQIRRLDVRFDHSTRLFAAPRAGRDQEDYLGGRVLVFTGEGWEPVMSAAPCSGWETRIPDGLAAALRALRIGVLHVECTQISGLGLEVDEAWVEATAELFEDFVLAVR